MIERERNKALTRTGASGLWCRQRAPQAATQLQPCSDIQGMRDQADVSQLQPVAMDRTRLGSPGGREVAHATQGQSACVASGVVLRVRCSQGKIGPPGALRDGNECTPSPTLKGHAQHEPTTGRPTYSAAKNQRNTFTLDTRRQKGWQPNKKMPPRDFTERHFSLSALNRQVPSFFGGTGGTGGNGVAAPRPVTCCPGAGPAGGTLNAGIPSNVPLGAAGRGAGAAGGGNGAARGGCGAAAGGAGCAGGRSEIWNAGVDSIVRAVPGVLPGGSGWRCG